jgi:hypothetical protein
MAEEKEEKTITISFRATPTEAAAIDAEAAKSGFSRADHVRSKVLSNAEDETNIGSFHPRLEKLENLIKHGIYITNQVYVALFSIAEAEGKAGRFLSMEQLATVYDRVRAVALGYAVEFPERFNAVQAEITAMSKKQEA